LGYAPRGGKLRPRGGGSVSMTVEKATRKGDGDLGEERGEEKE